MISRAASSCADARGAAAASAARPESSGERPAPEASARPRTAKSGARAVRLDRVRDQRGDDARRPGGHLLAACIDEPRGARPPPVEPRLRGRIDLRCGGVELGDSIDGHRSGRRAAGAGATPRATRRPYCPCRRGARPQRRPAASRALLRMTVGCEHRRSPPRAGRRAFGARVAALAASCERSAALSRGRVRRRRDGPGCRGIRGGSRQERPRGHRRLPEVLPEQRGAARVLEGRPEVADLHRRVREPRSVRRFLEDGARAHRVIDGGADTRRAGPRRSLALAMYPRIAAKDARAGSGVVQPHRLAARDETARSARVAPRRCDQGRDLAQRLRRRVSIRRAAPSSLVDSAGFVEREPRQHRRARAVRAVAAARERLLGATPSRAGDVARAPQHARPRGRAISGAARRPRVRRSRGREPARRPPRAGARRPPPGRGRTAAPAVQSAARSIASARDRRARPGDAPRAPNASSGRRCWPPSSGTGESRSAGTSARPRRRTRPCGSRASAASAPSTSRSVHASGVVRGCANRSKRRRRSCAPRPHRARRVASSRRRCRRGRSASARDPRARAVRASAPPCAATLRDSRLRLGAPRRLGSPGNQATSPRVGRAAAAAGARPGAAPRYAARTRRPPRVDAGLVARPSARLATSAIQLAWGLAHRASGRAAAVADRVEEASREQRSARPIDRGSDRSPAATGSTSSANETPRARRSRARASPRSASASAT